MSAIAIPRTRAAELAPRWFALRAFGNEAGKGLRLMWRHRAIMITSIVMNGLMYLMIQFFIGGGHIVLPVMALTILDALGYGLLMTALTLRLASIGAVVHVFNMAVMFFGGMFIPITLFPHGVEIFARFVPTALGVEVLNTALAGRGLGAAWSDGTLPWLLVHVVVLAGLGWTAYLYTVRRARREGGLSPQ